MTAHAMCRRKTFDHCTAGDRVTRADHEHRAFERRYWERQARASEHLNWTTGGSALIALAAFVCIYFSVTAAEKAANAARQ